MIALIGALVVVPGGASTTSAAEPTVHRQVDTATALFERQNPWDPTTTITLRVEFTRTRDFHAANWKPSDLTTIDTTYTVWAWVATGTTPWWSGTWDAGPRETTIDAPLTATLGGSYFGWDADLVWSAVGPPTITNNSDGTVTRTTAADVTGTVTGADIGELYIAPSFTAADLVSATMSSTMTIVP